MAKPNSRGMQPNGRKAGGGTFLKALHAIFDHEDYLALSKPARALLWDLARQYNQRNNGNLSAAPGTMARYGYSKASLHRLTRELVKRGWIAVTRTPIHPRQCYLYRLTWLDVDDWDGEPTLDDGARNTPRRMLK